MLVIGYAFAQIFCRFVVAGRLAGANRQPSAAYKNKHIHAVAPFPLQGGLRITRGPNPGNERQNAKPSGVMGCEVQYAQGALPEQETGWISLGLDTASPMLHHVTETTPPTFYYRARYVDKKLNYGNFGDPVECTVTV